MNDDATRNIARRIRGGFTIVELLIVTAMIILLLSILVVAVNRASRTAQITNTRALMNSISQALVRFKEDVGYYPPVLEDDRLLSDIPDPESFSYAEEVQNWYSITTLAEYLIGYDWRRYDGYGSNTDDPNDTSEMPTPGIRDPGPDGVWGGSVDRNGDGTIDLDDRNPPTEGKRLGSYLQIKDERLIASTAGDLDQNDNLIVFFPGEGGYDPDDPKVITDYWGRPIRYYRTVYKPGAIKYRYRLRDTDGDGIPDLPDFNGDGVADQPTLADLFVLRPWEVTSGAESDSKILDFFEDGTASYQLRTAAFALFSPGPDRSQDATTRFDAFNNPDVEGDADGIDGENEDNIVEVGP